MSGPLVSIVVPVYNVESYIEECLQSVCSQTYENLEIICVDDVGNDRSMDVVRSFAVKDCRIKIIEHDKNKGLAEARNTGLEHVSGDYVFFLDSDDWLVDDAIEKLLSSAMTNNADVVVGQLSAFSDDESEEMRIFSESLNAWLSLPDDDLCGKELFTMVNRIPCVACGKLFRVDFLYENDLKFISAKVRHEDNGFHLKCMSCHPKICFLGYEVYRYRIHRTSIMGGLREENGKQKTDLADLRRVLDDACDFVRLRNPKFVDFVRDSYWDAFAFRGLGCVFYWGRYRKYLRIGSVVLIKEGVSSDGKRHYLKVLGLKVYEKPFVL